MSKKGELFYKLSGNYLITLLFSMVMAEPSVSITDKGSLWLRNANDLP